MPSQVITEIEKTNRSDRHCQDESQEHLSKVEIES